MLASKNLITKAILSVLLIGLIQSSSPSLWLNWGISEPVHAVAIEVTATELYDETYWMTCGWNSGYSGFQTTKSYPFVSTKMMLFSIWDTNQPKLIFKDSRTYSTTFGGEGEGLSIRA